MEWVTGTPWPKCQRKCRGRKILTQALNWCSFIWTKWKRKFRVVGFYFLKETKFVLNGFIWALAGPRYMWFNSFIPIIWKTVLPSALQRHLLLVLLAVLGAPLSLAPPGGWGEIFISQKLSFIMNFTSRCLQWDASHYNIWEKPRSREIWIVINSH